MEELRVLAEEASRVANKWTGDDVYIESLVYVIYVGGYARGKKVGMRGARRGVCAGQEGE